MHTTIIRRITGCAELSWLAVVQASCVRGFDAIMHGDPYIHIPCMVQLKVCLYVTKHSIAEYLSIVSAMSKYIVDHILQ